MNIIESIRYLAHLQGIEDIDFLEDVRVHDDGSGPYIKEFNLAMEQPTVTELIDAAGAAREFYAASDYIGRRLAAYPPIGEQLDMIYKDGINGTTSFVDLITSIKEQYPKG